MFSIFEKLKFVFTTKVPVIKRHKKASLDKKPRSKWTTIARRVLFAIFLIIGALFLLGLILSYTTSPTIYVDHSYENKVYLESSPTIITGYVSSGLESSLKINGQDVELVNRDFAHEVSLKKGDNRFVFEATNDRGTTKELYILNLNKAN